MLLDNAQQHASEVELLVSVEFGTSALLVSAPKLTLLVSAVSGRSVLLVSAVSGRSALLVSTEYSGYRCWLAQIVAGQPAG
jgi:hypothetical protein